MALKISLIRTNAIPTLSSISCDYNGRFRFLCGLRRQRCIHIECMPRYSSIPTKRLPNSLVLKNPTKYSPSQAHKLHTSSPMLSSSQANISYRIPPNSWDSHMHVVDPSSYPLSPTAQYTPTPHTLSQAIQFYSRIGIGNMVFVQPSIYGNDNSYMLSALRELGPGRGRAVVTFDPTTIELSTLQEWHSIGVRGVRVNLVSVGKDLNAAELAVTLRQYADVIRSLDWVLQLYVPLKMAIDLQNIVPMLGVKVCLDHFGQPTLLCRSAGEELSRSLDPYILPGFGAMIELLKQGNTYVKFSAPYRISSHEEYSDLEPLAKELLRVAGKTSVVFATDWPHTRFEGLDINPFIEKALEWCGNDENLVERLFRGNAEQLWGVET